MNLTNYREVALILGYKYSQLIRALTNAEDTCKTLCPFLRPLGELPGGSAFHMDASPVHVSPEFSDKGEMLDLKARTAQVYEEASGSISGHFVRILRRLPSLMVLRQFQDN